MSILRSSLALIAAATLMAGVFGGCGESGDESGHNTLKTVAFDNLSGFIENDRWKKQRFFMERVEEYVRSDPAGFIGGLVGKALRFISSREIPRNVDVYVMSNWSKLLGILAWKVGGFGFPFGVLLPLAILGAIAARREISAPFWLLSCDRAPGRKASPSGPVLSCALAPAR